MKGATRKNMGNERNAGQIVIRYDAVLKKRLDAYTDQLKKEQPFLNITRADAIRALLSKGLDAEGVKSK
jgi:hypothetical protein